MECFAGEGFGLTEGGSLRCGWQLHGDDVWYIGLEFMKFSDYWGWGKMGNIVYIYISIIFLYCDILAIGWDGFWRESSLKWLAKTEKHGFSLKFLGNPNWAKIIQTHERLLARLRKLHESLIGISSTSAVPPWWNPTGCIFGGQSYLFQGLSD